MIHSRYNQIQVFQTVPLGICANFRDALMLVFVSHSAQTLALTMAFQGEKATSSCFV